MKKIFSMLLIIVILSSFTPTFAVGTFFYDNFECTLINTTVNIVGYSSANDSVISIPDQINGYDNIRILSSAFFNCKNLVEIKVNPTNKNYSSQDGILYNKSLTNLIKYPAEKQGDSFTIPDSTTYIETNAFAFCNKLLSITIPSNVITISINAIYPCYNLKEINVGILNLNYISQNGILYDKGLTKLINYPAAKQDAIFAIPDSVTYVERSSFAFCSNLTSLSIPNSVITIGDGAFANCKLLTSILIPNSVKTIGKSVFANTRSLLQIDVESKNKNYVSVNGVLYTSDLITLICYPTAKRDFSFIIPSSVTSIEISAFALSKNLTSIVIPNSVTSIGSFAFFSCTNLVIYGNDGFYSQKYAQDNNLAFRVIEDKINIISSEVNLTTNTITVNIENNTGNDFTNLKIITAVYNNGKLITQKINNIDELINGNTNSQTFQFDSATNLSDYKIFILKDFSSIMPLSNVLPSI